MQNVKQETVQSVIEHRRGSSIDSSVYSKGRYTAILDSHKKFLMLYAAPAFGMSWDKWLVKTEMDAYINWTMLSPFKDDVKNRKTGSTAAIIVNNEKEWADLYQDIFHKRKKNETFGGSFDHVYLLPNNKAGAEQLSDLMLYDDDYYNKFVVQAVLKTGLYQSTGSRLFMLRDAQDGTETALGIQIDAKQMMEIAGKAKIQPNKRFRILAYDWAAGYFTSVMPPNVEVRILYRKK